MERLTLDQDQVQAQREAALAANKRMRFGIDFYFTEPEDLPDRPILSPVSRLKLFDDVELADGSRQRVIAPAPGRDRFTAFGEVGGTAKTATWSVRDVVDRAPADAQEEPMPIWPMPQAPDPVAPAEPDDSETPERVMAALRLSAFRLIDANSDLLFASGVEFMDVVLSLSLEAQARYHNMDYLRNETLPSGDPVLPYPITFSSLDDTQTVTLTAPDDVHGLYLTAVARVAEIVASGNTQKDYVRDVARTASELRSYTDPRALPAVIPVEP